MEKLKRILLMENKIFQLLHITSIIFIIILAIIIAIEIYLNNEIKLQNEKNLLEDIEIVDDTDDITTSRPYESEEVLLNPGKGFALRGSLNKDYDNIVSVVYYRLHWS